MPQHQNLLPICPSLRRLGLGNPKGLLGLSSPEGLRATGLLDPDFGRVVGPRGRDHVDLRAANRALLRRAGVRDERIEDVGGCTVCAPGPRYESYRRDGAASLRMRGIIAPALLMLLLLAGCTRTAVPTTPDLSAVMASAQTHLVEERPGEAEAALRPVLEQVPDDAHVRAVLARALHAQERYAEASVQGRLALGIDPSLWEAAYNLACHTAMGTGEFARRLRSFSANSQPGSDVRRFFMDGGAEEAEFEQVADGVRAVIDKHQDVQDAEVDLCDDDDSDDDDDDDDDDESDDDDADASDDSEDDVD